MHDACLKSAYLKGSFITHAQANYYFYNRLSGVRACDEWGRKPLP